MTLLCNRRLVLQALSLCSAWPLMSHSQDADFPSRPIKLIVPNAPGSSVVSGETHWTLTPAPAAMALVKGGRLRILGHSLAKGTHPLGHVPAIADTVPDFEYGSWIGLMAPKGLPPSVADKLRKSLVPALQQPALRDGFDGNGAVPSASTAEEFRDYLIRDIEQNRRAIRTAGVLPELTLENHD